MKNTHFVISAAGTDLTKQFPGARIAQVDGDKAQSVKDFLEQIGHALDFPDYYAKNLDSLDELLNDLEWIDEEEVVIYISRSGDWLSKEKSEDKIFTLLDLLDATAEDWKWMDEEDEADKKSLSIVFEDSDRIRGILDDQEIPVTTIS